eukprot:COSAG01_NODE_13695_length_1547_cov_1.117403_1_plen_181_part_00
MASTGVSKGDSRDGAQTDWRGVTAGGQAPTPSRASSPARCWRLPTRNVVPRTTATRATPCMHARTPPPHTLVSMQRLRHELIGIATAAAAADTGSSCPAPKAALCTALCPPSAAYSTPPQRLATLSWATTRYLFIAIHIPPRRPVSRRRAAPRAVGARGGAGGGGRANKRHRCATDSHKV